MLSVYRPSRPVNSCGNRTVGRPLGHPIYDHPRVCLPCLRHALFGRPFLCGIEFRLSHKQTIQEQPTNASVLLIRQLQHMLRNTRPSLSVLVDISMQWGLGRRLGASMLNSHTRLVNTTHFARSLFTKANKHVRRLRALRARKERNQGRVFVR